MPQALIASALPTDSYNVTHGVRNEKARAVAGWVHLLMRSSVNDIPIDNPENNSDQSIT